MTAARSIALAAFLILASVPAKLAASSADTADQGAVRRQSQADPPAGQAYWLVASDGGVFAFGDAGFFGSTGGIRLNQPIVSMTPTPTSQGYWFVASDGGVFAFGDAGFFGSTGGIRLNQPIVSMAATPTGQGYWLMASDGGVFAFGDAGFFGSTGGIRLNQPIVSMAATPTGQGYWLVASDGGVFAFGDGAFHGSTGSLRLNRPVVGMSATPTGDGYWFVASDGGVFAFGDGAFHGSTGSLRLNQPIVAMSATPSGAGYWFVASDGGVFAFGDAGFHGSTGGLRLNRPVVGMTGEVDRRPYEVWATDQSGTAGKLYVYDGLALIRNGATASPEVVDLSGAVSAMCLAETGVAPSRAHMLHFNDTNTHAILSYVASGHVVFINASTRQPVKCLRASPGVGGVQQAHAALATPNDRWVILANQNGKLLERINTDADGNGNAYEDAADIALDAPAVLDLAGCTTPNSVACEDAALRPDNAPICPIIDSSSRLAFVTLRGGGMLVVNVTTSPMSIVAEYDRNVVHPNGCGGVESRGRMYINSGGGTTTNPAEFDVYSFALSGFPASGFNPPNQPAPKVVLSADTGDRDSHGMVLGPHGRFVWAVDRFANLVEVIDTADDSSAGSFELTTEDVSDPAPDLAEPAPSRAFAFASLRGACPLTANAPGVNNAVGERPGVGVLRILGGGRSGQLLTVAPITEPAPGGFDCPTRTDDAPGSITNAADVHGIRVRLK